ncbi:MAG: hypothetical protein ACLSS9_09915, partial [Acutalibacteraceae bacterium]
VYSQSAPTWGNNALKLPDSPDFDLGSNNQKKIVPFPFSSSFTDVIPSPHINPAPDPKFDDKPAENKLFYGADIKKGKFRFVTGPMPKEKAYEWVVLNHLSGIYEKNSNWGLYCYDGGKAYNMAFILGGLQNPVWHQAEKGKYAHYHVGGYSLFDKYAHFHVWYGVNGK